VPEVTAFDAIADELYATNPDDFVPARDDAVARAKDAGDKELARAVARLRRPTKAAWLANLLARHRAEQLDGLLALAGDLADAQRTLDGATLRALSAQRNRLVAAMAREAGRLAAQAGDSAGDSVIRDVSGILEAALADPDVAADVRAGRLTRTVSYSGFGPAARPGAVQARPAPPATAPPAADAPDHDLAERERAEREHRERAQREQAVAEAETAEARARDRQEADEAARVDAEQDHADARSRVADLAAELDAARDRERAAAAAAREAGVTARESARVASAAATAAARARAHRAELDR
jgi:hypothetical protein